MDSQRANREGANGLRPRGFSLKMLLYSFGAMPFGIGLITWVLRTSPKDASLSSFVLAWVGGGALIFSGIGALFHRPILGMAIGFGLQVIIVLMFLMLLSDSAAPY